jgi:hypothetical protein
MSWRQINFDLRANTHYDARPKAPFGLKGIVQRKLTGVESGTNR